jgi:hypothetical protein
MITSTGMNPKASNRVRLRDFDSPIHQPTAGGWSDKLLRHSEEAEFAQVRLSEVEFEKALVTVLNLQRVHADCWMVDY